MADGPILPFRAILLILVTREVGEFAQGLAPQVYHTDWRSQVRQAEIDQLLLNIDQLEIDNDKLQEDSRILAALQAAGVDNWEGYEMAMENV